MSYFLIGINILFAATLIFYIVFFSLVYYWHEKRATFIVVPIIYTFEFFLAGFLVVSIISILLDNLPQILNTFIK
ncbi:MAG: hypothetical protein HY219_01900 [Candidatus Staskawiczbacteria bacterium]|nr:hypothetical protein [Candidatus Staskawiczbacteria bacterium]